MFKKNKISFIILIVVASLFFTAAVFAQSGVQEVKLDNPVSINANPSSIIGIVIKAFLGLVGGVALVMMVWGGFQWLTSAGNAEKVKKGSMTMVWSIVGLVLTLSSYLILNTVLEFLK